MSAKCTTHTVAADCINRVFDCFSSHSISHNKNLGIYNLYYLSNLSIDRVAPKVTEPVLGCFPNVGWIWPCLAYATGIEGLTAVINYL